MYVRVSVFWEICLERLVLGFFFLLLRILLPAPRDELSFHPFLRHGVTILPLHGCCCCYWGVLCCLLHSPPSLDSFPPRNTVAGSNKQQQVGPKSSRSIQGLLLQIVAVLSSNHRWSGQCDKGESSKKISGGHP